jgi:hypothetical protein
MVSFMLSRALMASGLRRRIAAFAFLASASSGAAVVLIACTTDETPVDDAGTDGSVTNETSTGDAKPDTAIKTDGDPPTDGGGGNCTAVTGACDIVLQNCADLGGKKQECVVTTVNSKLTTQCVPVQTSQQLPIGHGCCPGADNPCLPGLTCVGDDCVDGDPVLARCTPACCKDDHAACGKSDPEGIGGQCDLTLFSGNEEVHRVCSYRERCKPYKIEPCKTNQTCLVEDKAGTSGCISSNNVALRQPCEFANDCADGLICVGGADAGVCRMYCLTPNSNPPFDASAADGAPGRGGCPPQEQCTGPKFTNLPDWLQLCEYSDGG